MVINLHLREDILQHFPNFEYWNCTEPERLDFSQQNNLCGDQQEAFLLYWSLKVLKETHGVGVDIGCGQGAHIASIGINDYCGSNHKIYGGNYEKAHIASLAEDVDKIFNPNTLSWIIASHILEHVNDPIMTFRKWCKLIHKGGLIILLQPDANYEKPNPWDFTHKNFYTPEDFRNNCILPNQDLIKEVEFNTLNNNFSMNFVGRRI